MQFKGISQRPTAVPAATRAMLIALPWPRIALTAILLVAAFMNLFRLTREGYGNVYYAATVQSMLGSLHNFLYASFDPGGFVSVDKPPLGFWIQAASAVLLGFNGLSLLLPQAIAGVLSVAVLYHLVRRAYGTTAGLLAALCLALTPISVVTNRNNTMDSLLVLTVLLAAWMVILAVETGRLRWLLLGAAVLGIGFNIKMLEAYLVLPAFWLLYLLATRLPWRRKLANLALATVVLIAVSLSWALAVDLTPPSQRPFVGSSTDNSVLELIVGHNGLDRLLPKRFFYGQHGELSVLTDRNPQRVSSTGQAAVTRDGGSDGSVASPFAGGFAGRGQPGPLRLFDRKLAGQISWLLPVALLGLALAAYRSGFRLPRSRRQQAVLMWGAWLVTQVVFFSVASQFQPYYMVMMAPAVAALVGIGSVELWQAYRGPAWTGWLLPAALVGSVAVAAYILIPFPDWNRRLLPGVLILGILSVVVLVITRFRGRYPARLLYPAAVAGMLAVLVAPTAWAAIPVWSGSGSRPYAGPEMILGRGPASLAQYQGVIGGPASTGFNATKPVVDHRLVNYLLGHWDTERYLVGTLNANVSAPIILETGAPVMTLGGFLGTDPILTASQLASLVTGGDIRFFLLPEMTGEEVGPDGAAKAGQQEENVRWVTEHCKPVPVDLWQSTSSEKPHGLSDDATRRFGDFRGRQQLFDCSGAGKSMAVTETAG